MVVRKGVKQDFVEHDTSFYCSILVVKEKPPFGNIYTCLFTPNFNEAYQYQQRDIG